MKTTLSGRRLVAAAAATLAAIATFAVSPATSPTAEAAAPAQAAPATTRLTFLVPDCPGCRITLHQAIRGRRSVWQTDEKRAHDSKVTFTVPTKRTHGLDATIRGPWENRHSIPTGYVSQVVFRYGKEDPGSTVSAAAAKQKKWATACWAGTGASAMTIPLEVRKVGVGGTTGRTHGTLAWTSTTQDYWNPMDRTSDKGIYGTQDVPFCARPATDRQARQRAATTDLTVALRGCARCSLQLQHAIDGAGDTVWTSRRQTAGPDHQVTFRVRSARTHGMSFVLRAPWEGNTGAVPNVVTRYVGHAPGDRVGRDDARHGRRAEGCWAGTDASAARLTFQVDRVRTRTLDGHPTQSPLTYSRHTLASWKPLSRTYKGTIGNQDAFYCTHP